MKVYDDRMPVILDPPALAAWIDPKTTPDVLAGLMMPYAGKLLVERANLVGQ
jgi:putative SOS response-associated peptidase YedK